MSQTSLNTELSGQLEEKPREDIEEDLQRIWDDNISDEDADYTEYISAGEDILNYHMGMVPGDIELFDELNQAFYSMGQNAAWLTKENEDRGIVDEEPVWLGHLTPTVGDATSSDYSPSKELLEMPYMDELTDNELQTLHVKYMEGKNQEFQSQWDYGGPE